MKTKAKKNQVSLAVKGYTPYIYILPAVLVLVIMVFYPFGYGFWISLTNMSLRAFKNPSFIGFDNYVKVFSDDAFVSTFTRTVVWTGINVFFHVVLGVFLAILLNRKLPGKAIIRVALIIPWAMPQYIAALTWRGMLNNQFGAINNIITSLGFDQVPWLTNPTMLFVGAILANIWLGFPFMMMIALGGLQSIPNDMYEAADLDGASNWQKIKNITLPLLKPVMVPAIVLGTVWTFNMLNVIIIIAGKLTNEKSQILVTEVYRKAFTLYRYGYAAAYSVVIFFILMLFSYFFIKVQFKDQEVS